MNIRTTSAVLALTMVGGLNVAAQEEGFKPSFMLGTDVSTAYIFRGATLHDKPVAQPYLYADPIEGLTVGAWGNILLDDGSAGDAVDVNEVDLYAEYDLPVGEDFPLGISLAYTEYTYPNSTIGEGTVEDPTVSLPSDREVGLLLSMPWCPLGSTLKAFYGVDGGIDKSLYAEYGIGHSFEGVAEGVTPSLGATVGYADIDGGESGFSAATVTAGVAVGIATFKVIYIAEIDDDVLTVDKDVVGTISLSSTF